MKTLLKAATSGLAIGFLLQTLSACSSVSKNSSVSVSPPAKKEVAAEKDLGLSTRRYFDWPVNEARLTRGFFTHPARRKGKPHMGIDLAAPKGTPIMAAHNGLVIYVGKEFRGYGRVVMIEGRDGFASLYAHLSKANVKPGQQVKQGQLVGAMGRTGHATGVHLHFEIRRQTGPVAPLLSLPQTSVAAHSQTGDDNSTTQQN